MIGRLVGSYRIERRLGQGGMGTVYLARHGTLPNTFVAVKVLRDHRVATQLLRDRFRQEAVIAAALGSHRVVRPIDVGEFGDGTPYIVMEYIEGRSLAEELKEEGPLPLITALKIACRISDTMVVAHAQGVIHRDLKPSNVMLTQAGTKEFVVKLLDFGIARASGQLKVAHTVDPGLMGTPGYIAPETVRGQPTDARVDVFSLGVILFEMLTGRLPFDGPSVYVAFERLMTDPLPDISSLRPPSRGPIPPTVQDLVARSLTRQPEDRLDMAGFHEVAAALLSEPAVEPASTPQTLMSIRMPHLSSSEPPPPAVAATRPFAPLPVSNGREAVCPTMPDPRSSVTTPSMLATSLTLGPTSGDLGMPGGETEVDAVPRSRLAVGLVVGALALAVLLVVLLLRSGAPAAGAPDAGAPDGSRTRVEDAAAPPRIILPLKPPSPTPAPRPAEPRPRPKSAVQPLAPPEGMLPPQ